jgi:hypothetical protein
MDTLHGHPRRPARARRFQVRDFLRAGDRGRTGDLVLGKRIASGHHTISAHRTRKFAVPRPWTAHRMGSIGTQSGTHQVHSSSQAYPVRMAHGRKRCVTPLAPDERGIALPAHVHRPTRMNRRGDARPRRAESRRMPGRVGAVGPPPIAPPPAPAFAPAGGRPDFFVLRKISARPRDAAVVDVAGKRQRKPSADEPLPASDGDGAVPGVAVTVRRVL